MMKQLPVYILLLFCVQIVRSQPLNKKIKGELLFENNFKYAYLLDDKDTMPMIAEVTNNKFEFTVVKKDKFDLRTLCLTVDSIDRMALVSEKKGFSSQNSRLIAMEDLTIAIGLDLPGAIVKGGPANIEVDEMFKALHSKDFDKFFKDHSDSQISLLLLRSLIRLTEISSDFSYPCTTYFGTLSERLKATPEGQTVKALLTK